MKWEWYNVAIEIYRDIPIPPNGHLGYPIAPSWILTTVSNLASISKTLSRNTLSFSSLQCPKTQNFCTFLITSLFLFFFSLWKLLILKVKLKRWGEGTINNEVPFLSTTRLRSLFLLAHDAFPFTHHDYPFYPSFISHPCYVSTIPTCHLLSLQHSQNNHYLS